MRQKTKPEVVLVSVKDYSDKWGLTRKSVYRRLKRHLLTIYRVQGSKNKKLGLPKLNPEEDPGELSAGPITNVEKQRLVEERGSSEI